MGAWRTRIRRRHLAAVVLVACVVTPLFNVLTSGPSLAAVRQGLIDGLIIPGLVGGYLIFVRDGRLRGWFRSLGFWADIALSGAIVLILFLVGRGLAQVVTSGRPERFLASFGDAHLASTLPFFAGLALAIQFVLQMNRLIGASVFRYFVTGAYHRPTPEERIFLFLDLEGSTHLVQRLGSARYFEMLRRFVDDLTEPVLETEGEIYQYAGDEVVVTWPLARGVRAANCVRCFFRIQAAVGRRARRYRRDFGTVPRFRGGLHGGPVTAGELGDLRQQIVFVGDCLNTAARLEEFAKQHGHDLVVSGALLERLTLPRGLEAAHCGDLALRGLEAPVAAYSLQPPPRAR